MTTHDDLPRQTSAAGYIPWYWSNEQLFAGVGASARNEFIAVAKKREFQRNESVFHANHRANDVYYVHAGLIKIYNVTPAGSVVIYWFCAPGALFGAGGITGSDRQSVSAQAVRRSLVLSVPRTTFERLLAKEPRLALNVIRLMGSRLRLACDAVAEQATLDARARLARLLTHVAHAQERGHGSAAPASRAGPTRVHITQQELADMSGMSRQTVNALLSEFKARGLLSTDRGSIAIQKLDEFIAKVANRP